MAGFELLTSGVGSNRFTYWATTIAESLNSLSTLP